MTPSVPRLRAAMIGGLSESETIVACRKMEESRVFIPRQYECRSLIATAQSAMIFRVSHNAITLITRCNTI